MSSIEASDVVERRPEMETTRILVHHTFGRSCDIICRLLEESGLTCESPGSIANLAEAVQEGAAAVVIGDNLLRDDCSPLRTALEAQPDWSDLPVVVLVGPGQSAGAIDLIEKILGENVVATVLEQPVRSLELVSSAQTALRTRFRQYELRDHLERERSLRIELEDRRRELSELNETLEERVAERSLQVRELSRALTRAEQKERRRIAMILHDDLQQRLYAVQMKMGFARQDAQAGRPDEVLKDLDEANAWIQATVDIARNLTTDVSPPVLESEGLAGSLEWVIAQMKELHGLNVELEASHSFQTRDEDMRALLTQIVRELLFNVVKHAETDAAWVTLTDTNGCLRIDVEDKGRGFDLEELETRKGSARGFGLPTNRERLELFGGELHIKTEPGVGTLARIELPVELEHGK